MKTDENTLEPEWSLAGRPAKSAARDRHHDSAHEEPTLLVTAGPCAGRRLILADLPATIGRGRRCEVTLDAPGVSRRHLRVDRNAHGHLVIEDLASTNGTFVGNERIKTHVLSAGEQVIIGSDTVLMLAPSGAVRKPESESLSERGVRDDLTGVFTKRYFLNKLREEHAHHLRARQAVSTIKLSIDAYRDINEVFSQEAGDLVLVRVAEIIAEASSAAGICARWGAKKFALLLGGQDEHSAWEIAERIRRAVDDGRVEWEGRRIPVTVSVGIATLRANDICEMQELLDEANDNLIRAKFQGGNCSVASKLDE